MIRLKISLEWALLSLLCSFPVFYIIDPHAALSGEAVFILGIITGSAILSANLLYRFIITPGSKVRSAGVFGTGVVLISYALFGLIYSILGAIVYPGKFSLDVNSVLLGWAIWTITPLLVTGIYCLPASYWLGKKQHARFGNPASLVLSEYRDADIDT